MSRLDKFAEVLYPEVGVERSIPQEEMHGAQFGHIYLVTLLGVVVTLDDFDEGIWKFGPYPYHGFHLTGANTGDTVAGGTNHHHSTTIPAPVAGNSCLVMFVGPGTDRACVVAWWT